MANAKSKAKDNPFKNYILMTLTIATDPEGRYSDNSGTFWTRLRASLYMGKDKDGHYRPSKFFTLKAFAKGEEAHDDRSVAAGLAGLNKGERVTVQGHLDYAEFQRKDGTTGSEDIIIVTKIVEVLSNGRRDGGETDFEEPNFD